MNAPSIEPSQITFNFKKIAAKKVKFLERNGNHPSNKNKDLYSNHTHQLLVSLPNMEKFKSKDIQQCFKKIPDLISKDLIISYGCFIFSENVSQIIHESVQKLNEWQMEEHLMTDKQMDENARMIQSLDTNSLCYYMRYRHRDECVLAQLCLREYFYIALCVKKLRFFNNESTYEYEQKKKRNINQQKNDIQKISKCSLFSMEELLDISTIDASFNHWTYAGYYEQYCKQNKCLDENWNVFKLFPFGFGRNNDNNDDNNDDDESSSQSMIDNDGRIDNEYGMEEKDQTSVVDDDQMMEIKNDEIASQAREMEFYKNEMDFNAEYERIHAGVKSAFVELLKKNMELEKEMEEMKEKMSVIEEENEILKNRLKNVV